MSHLDRRSFVGAMATSSLLAVAGCQVQRRRDEEVREVGHVVSAKPSRDGAAMTIAAVA